MTEPSKKLDRKLKLEKPSKREEYLALIDRVLEVSYTKFNGKYCKNAERLAWARAIATLVNAGSAVLRDQDLDTLLVRVEKLEQKKGVKK